MQPTNTKPLAPAACQIVRMLATETRPCTRCGSVIYFVQINERPHPFDANGESHWATCPNAEDFRRKRKEAAKTPSLFDGPLGNYPD